MKALRILEEDLLNSNSTNQEKYIKDAIKEIEELENIAGNAKNIQKDIQRLKILFDSEFCRCSKCGEYKRSGFGCFCENE